MRPGKTVAGKLHTQHKKMVNFDPKLYHGVESWTGSRWSITAFQTRSSVGLDHRRTGELEDFGFKLKASEVLHLSENTTIEALISSYPIWSSHENASRTSYPAIEEQADGAEIPDDAELDEEVLEQAPERETLSESQKNLIKKIHINTGHPPRDRLLRTLKAAGRQRPAFLRYVRDEFQCQACDTKRGPDHRRKAQCPRTFAFNKVLSVDVFYHHFRGQNVPVLNLVCHGTGYHVAQRIVGRSRQFDGERYMEGFAQLLDQVSRSTSDDHHRRRK